MSVSHEMVEPLVKEIRRAVARFPDANIILETNKRVIIWCLDKAVSRKLAYDLRTQQLLFSNRRGKHSAYHYLEVYL